MALTGFFDLLVAFYQSVLGRLHDVKIYAFGFRAPFLDVIFVCVAIYMIVSIYWRGAKG